MTGADLLLGLVPAGQRPPTGRPSPSAFAAAPAPPRGGSSFAAAFARAAAMTGVPVGLLRAVAWQESGDNPTAVSSQGAVGVMQLMPQTAAALGVNPWVPAQNILGGAEYLAQQLRAFGGNLALALAAYNAGPAAVAAYGGVPPYPETQRYVQDVLALYRRWGAGT